MEALRQNITPMLYGSLVTSLLIAGAMVILIIDMRKEIKQYENRKPNP